MTNKNHFSRNEGAFTLVEILIGLSMSAAIFLVAISLVVNVFGSTTKSRYKALFSQVKNDLQAEFGNSVRWASNISTKGDSLQVGEALYQLSDGKINKNGSPITPDTVEIVDFVVKKYVPESTDASIGSGLTGQYFDEPNFKNLMFTQKDFFVDFDWGVGSPDPLIGNDTFSVRWIGQVLAPVSGNYTFYTATDDGARLWVGDTLLIDDWDIPGFQEESTSISLSSGTKYDIQLLYYDNFGPARARLAWAYPGVSKITIPTNMLYPMSGPVSVEIVVNMRIAGSSSLVDRLHLTLSPRGGSVITVE